MFYLQISPLVPRFIFGCLEQCCFRFSHRTRETAAKMHRDKVGQNGSQNQSAHGVIHHWNLGSMFYFRQCKWSIAFNFSMMKPKRVIPQAESTDFKWWLDSLDLLFSNPAEESCYGFNREEQNEQWTIWNTMEIMLFCFISEFLYQQFS